MIVGVALAALILIARRECFAGWETRFDIQDFSLSAITMRDFNHGHWLSGISKTIWELDQCYSEGCRPRLTVTPFEDWDFESAKASFGAAIGVPLLPFLDYSLLGQDFKRNIKKLEQYGGLQFAVCPSQYAYDEIQKMAYGLILGVKI